MADWVQIHFTSTRSVLQLGQTTRLLSSCFSIPARDSGDSVPHSWSCIYLPHSKLSFIWGCNFSTLSVVEGFLFICLFIWLLFFFIITIWAIRIIFLIKLNIQLNKYQLFLSFCSPCSDLKQKLNGGALPYMRRNKFIASKHKKEFIFFFSFLFFSQRWKNHFQVRFSCMFIVVLMIQCDNTQRGLCQETNILRDKDVLKLKS